MIVYTEKGHRHIHDVASYIAVMLEIQSLYQCNIINKINLWHYSFKGDWNGCCHVTELRTVWLALCNSLNLKFSFLD